MLEHDGTPPRRRALVAASLVYWLKEAGIKPDAAVIAHLRRVRASARLQAGAPLTDADRAALDAGLREASAHTYAAGGSAPPLTLEQWAYLGRERANAYRAVDLGLAHTTTAVGAAMLAERLYRIVETYGEWVRWRPTLVRCVAAAAGRHHLEIDLLLQLGNVYRFGRNAFGTDPALALDAAVAAHRRALALAEATMDVARQARACEQLAVDLTLYRTPTQLEEAQRIAEQALRLLGLQPAVDARLPASIHNNLGLVFRATGDPEQAIAHLEEAVARWSEVGDDGYLSRTLSNLGNAYRDAGRLEKATLALERARDAAARTADTVHQARVQLNLSRLFMARAEKAEAHLAAGWWREVQRVAEQADLRALRRAGATVLQAKLVHNLGMARRELGALAAAERALERALMLWIGAADSVQAANSEVELGHVYRAMGDAAKARALYQQARESMAHLLDEAPDDRRAACVLEEAATALSELPPVNRSA